MENVIFVLGATDAEMTEIQNVLTDLGITFVFAQHGGLRVHSRVMYEASAPLFKTGVKLVLVECGFAEEPVNEILHVIDHHREGDLGFGKPPKDFWEASSIGQTIHTLNALGLNLVPTEKQKLIAAADHCLGAAYKGQCPGIDIDALAEWRLRSRSQYFGISYEEISERLGNAMEEIKRAEFLALNDHVVVKDMRRKTVVKELPEAAMRMHMPYISGPVSTTKAHHKYTASGCPDVIKTFMEEWAPTNGFEGIYGDPRRGFAGAYLARN